MSQKTKLADVEKISDDCLTSQQVADVLGVSKKTFIKTAKNAPDDLHFPIIKVGAQIRIPRSAFLDYMHRGKNNQIDIKERKENE